MCHNKSDIRLSTYTVIMILLILFSMKYFTSQAWKMANALKGSATIRGEHAKYLPKALLIPLRAY